jgi:uncharacterized protein YjaZ
MQIINMLADYRTLTQQAVSEGPFPAYQAYTKKYPALFQSLFDYLYMTELEALRPLVEQTDFDAHLQAAEKNKADGFLDDIVSQIQAIADKLGFNQDFDLYLGMELGNLGGCALKANRPYVYIAIDRPLNASTLKYLLPHEFNHMVRISALPEIDMFDFQERTISEGLGAYAPIAHYDLPYTAETISSARGFSLAITKDLIHRQQEIHDRVTAHFGEPLTPELMQQFFMTNPGAEGPLLDGYFVGMQIIHALVEADIAFNVLTEMPCEEIWQRYLEL